MAKHSIPFALVLLLGGGAHCAEFRINSASEFVEFSNNVNSGTNYEGTTVFLDSDIDFSGVSLAPVGSSYSKYFHGTFNGQGHIISNLGINTSSGYAGLFGNSEGAGFKNVVMDSSCSVVSSSLNIGAIAGSCYSSQRSCIFEGIANMASVTYNGNNSKGYVYLGGISGRVGSYDYHSIVKNCANYGSITYLGVGDCSRIGGFIGTTGTSDKVYIQNCINYGAIVHSGTTNILYIGGFVGESGPTHFDNCINYGSISSNQSGRIGSITGAGTRSSMLNCYWSDKISYSGYGDIFSPSTIKESTKFNDNFELNEAVSVGEYQGTSLVEALNEAGDYYYLRGYSKWILNKNGKDATFKIADWSSSLVLNSKIILLPSPSDEGNNLFDGWYTDPAYASKFTKNEIDSNTELYGKYTENNEEYTVTFDTRGGSPIEPIRASFGSVVTLPNNSIKDYCSFSFWGTEYGDEAEWSFTIPSRNITLYAKWICTRISSLEDLILFADNIESGLTYEGMTVFLDSDLDFSGKNFEPIGRDQLNNFLGTFDGQGHIISNLVVNSSSYEYAGLFGYSNGLTIENVVLDDSCSFTSFNEKSEDVHIGGVIGYCYGEFGSCIIDNCVNMARISFGGDIDSSSFYGGGIAGYIYSYKYNLYVKNCANYGSVTNIGKSRTSYIGGIIGDYYCSKNGYIQNCLNYGTINNNGTSSNLYIGGIVGYSGLNSIENCVSGGRILSNTQRGNIGSIIGNVFSSSNITHSFWTSDTGYNKACGSGDLTIDTETAQTDLEPGTTTKLNTFAAKNAGWNKWSMVYLNGGRINNISQELLVVIHKYFPDPEKENCTFSGWFKDSTFTERYDPSEVDTAIDVYAKFISNYYALTFDFNNGEENDVRSLIFNSTIAYPENPSKEGYSFAGWSPNPERVGEMDLTITAQWTANKYTVAFNGNGGTPSKPSMEVTYDEIYGELPTAERTGYSFTGWFTEEVEGTNTTAEDIVKITANQTLYTHWTINQYTITFNSNGGSDCEPIKQDYNTAVELPKPTKTGYTFAHWCSDIDLASEYEGTTMPAEDKTLYAKWDINQYTLIFVFNNGSEDDVRTLDYNEEIDYPEGILKTGYAFIEWDNKQERMPADNITITAQWTANEYTVTFDVNGGNALSESKSKKQVTYDSTYGDLPEPSRTGYDFDGWFTEEVEGTNITAENVVKITEEQTLYAHWTANEYILTFNFGNGTVQSVVVPFNSTIEYPKDVAKEGFIFNGWDRIIGHMPAEDITITAQWREKEVEHVEIVFEKKNMSEKEAEEIIKSYTDEEFVIEKIDFDPESGETIVIIKFVDSSKTIEFVRHINEHKRAEDSFIKSANGVDYKGSSSPILSPLLFFYLI